MTESRIARLTAVAGIAFVVAGLAGEAIFPAPDPTLGPAAMSAFVRTHQNVPVLLTWWTGVGMTLFLLFAAGLFRALNPADGWLSRIGFGAVVVIVALNFMRRGLLIAAGLQFGAGNDASGLALLDANDEGIVRTLVYPNAIFLGSVAALIIGSARISRWLGWAAAAIAVFMFAAPLVDVAIPGSDTGFVGYFLLLAWLVAASVVLATRSGSFAGANSVELRSANEALS